MAALLGQLQGIHYVQHLLVGHVDWRVPKECIAHIRVKQAIVSGQSGDGLSRRGISLGGVKDAPLLPCLSPPGIAAWNLTAPKRLFLGIYAMFNERPSLAPNHVARSEE